MPSEVLHDLCSHTITFTSQLVHTIMFTSQLGDPGSVTASGSASGSVPTPVVGLLSTSSALAPGLAAFPALTAETMAGEIGASLWTGPPPLLAGDGASKAWSQDNGLQTRSPTTISLKCGEFHR